MTNLQIENLYIFYFLYNGCDRTCNLLGQSPDYLLEKWGKLIDITPPETKYPELQESKLYQEWYKIWVREGENSIPDSLMMFLIKTHPKENNGHYLRFLPLVNKFEKYIEKTHNITQEEYNHIHPLLVKSIQKVIDRTITDQDVREDILNNILS